MKVLALGGFGYIGSTFADYLLRRTEDHITIVDTLEFGVDPIYFYDVLNHERVRFIKDDISNLRTVYELIKKHDVVVDLAALTLPNSARDPGDAVFINKTMAEVIGDCCRKLDKRLVFLSTCSNYGKSSKLVDENGELFPVSIYAISKVDAEKYILKNVPKSIILRCATAYGVGAGRTRWDVLFNDFVRTALTKDLIDIFQPNAHRPICHVADISKAITSVIHAELPESSVYNVGTSAQNYTKVQLADIVKKKTGAKIKLTESEDTRDYKVDFGKIKRDLGFTADHTPEESIEPLANILELELGKRGVLSS